MPRNLPDLALRTSGDVYRVEAQADGKWIVSGSFYEVGDAPATNLARLDADGSLDAGWVPPITVPLDAVAVSPDSLYVAPWTSGVFKIPLSGNGDVDTAFWFDDSTSIATLAVDGGFLYVATYDGDVQRYDAATGNHDGSWTCAASGHLLIADHAGHLYVDQRRIDIADGALDPHWNAPTIAPGAYATALGRDGYLYVASHGAIGAGGIEGLARLRVDRGGAIDSAWRPVAVGDAADSSFDAILANGDGTVVVAGKFDRLGGGAHANLARLVGADGSADPTWSGHSDGEVTSLAMGPANSIVAAGTFTSIGNTPRASIARLSPNGIPDPAFVAALYAQAQVFAIAPDPAHGHTYVGGAFDWAGTERHRNILRLNHDGSLDSTWTPGTDAPRDAMWFTGGVHAIAVAANDVIVGGRFSRVDDVERHGIARLGQAAPGALDAGWNPDVRGNSFEASSEAEITAIALDAQGRALIGGNFTTVGGQPQAMLARLDAGGALDPAWRPDPYYPVLRIAYGGDALYFISFDDRTSRTYASKVRLDDDAFDDAWDQAAQGALQQVSDIVFADGRVFVSASADGFGLSRVYRLSAATGSVDSAWNPPTTCRTWRIAVDDAGAVYAGGNIPEGLDSRACLQRVHADGTLDDGFAPAWSSGSLLQALAVGEGGITFVGGSFGSISNVPRHSLAAFGADAIAVPTHPRSRPWPPGRPAMCAACASNAESAARHRRR
ncbi:MAG TPA: hypothetical protein VFS55_11320 [Dokdonella sp.]|nr:hypothetical protein [Dokdonella sp.]